MGSYRIAAVPGDGIGAEVAGNGVQAAAEQLGNAHALDNAIVAIEAGNHVVVRSVGG